MVGIVEFVEKTQKENHVMSDKCHELRPHIGLNLIGDFLFSPREHARIAPK